MHFFSQARKLSLWTFYLLIVGTELARSADRKTDCLRRVESAVQWELVSRKEVSEITQAVQVNQELDTVCCWGQGRDTVAFLTNRNTGGGLGGR